MTKLQLALIGIIPLSLIVLLTAVNRFWGWPTEGMRIPIALGASLALYFFFRKSKPSD
jgi:hypothetical protein